MARIANGAGVPSRGHSPRDGGGPNISVSGPGSRNLHSHHHAQSVSQQPQFGQQIHGRQARPLVGSFVEDVMGLSLVVLSVRWGHDGIQPVSAVRFVMSCWNM